MLKTLRRAGLFAVLVLAMAPAAQAAGPGDTLLESRPTGIGPLDPSLFAWNQSMVSDEPATSPSAPAITPDGRYAVFFSQADGLAPGQDPAFSHVLRKDLQTGAIAVADFGANGDSVSGDISDDGRYVVFTSRATNLTSADTTPDPDVFVKDLQNGTVTLLSPAVQGNDCLTCMQPVISGNGAEVAYVTNTAIVAGDTNNHTDVYAVARTGGTATFVSAKPGGTDSSTGTALDPSITDDGSMVAYRATGNDLDPGNDTTTDADLYTRVLANTSSKLASAQNGNDFGIAAGGVNAGQISGDGLKAVWSDSASYLAADTDSGFDIYSRTLATKVDTLISVTTGGTKGDGGSFQPATDATGRRVAFVTQAPNLGGSSSSLELAVRDTTGGTTTSITSGAFASLPAVTHGSGDRVVFDARNAISDGPSPNAVHVASVGGGGLALVSQPATGGPLVPGLVGTFPPDFYPSDARVSSDGRYVVFESSAPGLGGSGNRSSCFRRDNVTNQLLLLVSTCASPTVSGDGQRIAFLTDDPLDPGADSGTDSDIYVHDMASGANILVSRASGAGPKANGNLGDFEISADGRRVAFVSSATNLGVASGRHVYVRDVGSGDTFIADRTTTGATTTDPVVDGAIGISGNGSRVAFGTTARLDPALDDASGGTDVYVRDLAASTTTLASRQSDAAGGAKGSLGSSEAGISQDGRFVMFKSPAENLVPAFAPWPPGSDSQVFIRDLTARTTTIASQAANGTVVGNSNINTVALDAGGDRIAMAVYGGPGSSNMAPGVSSDRYAVIVRDLPSLANVAVIQPAELGGSSFAVEGALGPALSGDGRCLAYFARGREVFPGVSPDFDQLYMRVLGGNCPTPAAAGGPTPVRPALSRVSMTNKRFRVGKKRTTVVAKKRRARRVKVGTAFRFRLNVPATVTIRIDRLTKGKRVKKRCVKPRAKYRKRKNCTRALKRGTLTRRSLKAGARRVAFSGRIGKKKLSPGSYRATLTASAAGLKSKPVRLRFTVVR